MAEHYFCEGTCAGVAHAPGTCQAADCPKHGEPLTPCDCEDRTHHVPKDEEADEEAEG